MALPAVVIGHVAKGLSRHSNSTEGANRGPQLITRRWVIFPMTPGASYIPELESVWIDSIAQDRKIRVLVPYLYMPDGDSLHFGIRTDITGHFHREWINPRPERKYFEQSIPTPVISANQAMGDQVEGYMLQFSYKCPPFVNAESLEPWVELDGNRRLPLIIPNPAKLSANDTVLRVFVPLALTDANSRVQFHAKLPGKATFHGQRLALPKGELPKEVQFELQSCTITPDIYRSSGQPIVFELHSEVEGFVLNDKMTMANKRSGANKFKANAAKTSISVPMMPKDVLHLHLVHNGSAKRHLLLKIPASLLKEEQIQLKADMLFGRPTPEKITLNLIIRNSDGQSHPLTIKWNSKARSTWE